jgi:RNA polymerase sigma factor (sigma-70 family)
VGIEQATPHLPRLRRYARLLTGDAARADDLVQDTLERACRKWALFQPRPAPADGLIGWLLTLMHNLHLNRLRDHGPDDTHAELTEAREPVHDPAVSTGQRIDLERALARLPPPLLQVMLLVCVEDFSYAEAALATGVPVGTVMSRLSRARVQLRAVMTGDGVTGEPASSDGRPWLRAVK